MKKLSLQEIREVEVELLNYFDLFCKNNGINYFLSNGTLLGAIKYSGFIPWDDDIDVLVPRKDYNRLISLFRDSDHIKLFSFERNNNFYFPFSKLCDISTIKEEDNTNNGVTLGVDIDIFPLDFWDSEIEKAKHEVKEIKRKMFCLDLAKMKRPNSINFAKKIVKLCVMIICKIVGPKYYITKIINMSNKTSQIGSSYVGCKSWCIYGESEIIPSEVFENKIEVEFEGFKYPAPVGYDKYLHSLYGDYEFDPPIEKQKSHHKYTAYRL